MNNLSTKEIGGRGENLAADYLKNKGYEIVARNYVPSWFRQGRKEIDIITKKDGALVFVEVKTGQASDGFFPEDRVDLKKQRFLIQAAQSYLKEKKVSLDTEWQIDVVAITLGEEKPGIEHFENAVSENQLD